MDFASLILDNIQHPVIVVNEQRKVVYANNPASQLLNQYGGLKELMAVRVCWTRTLGKLTIIEVDDLNLPQRLIAENADYLFDHLDDAVHIVNDQGYTIFYNRACEDLDGITRTDALNRSIFEIYPNLDRSQSTFFRVLEKGCELLRHENTYISNNGKHIDAISSTIPLKLKGRRAGAAEIVHNIINIRMLSERILDLHDRLTRTRLGKKATGARYNFTDLIGQNEAFLKSVRLAQRVAKTDLPVLIYGETGTGKELFAQSIHNASPNSNGPFVAINCAAIPSNLLESMLFGTVKGAFTGAQNRSGLLEHAAGGTIFFDEIQSLSPELQAKLLRVLQEGSFQRVGDMESLPLEARVVSALNIPPEEAVAAGLMREDLYFRLCVFKITIPPLRERRDDIPLLVKYFLQKFNQKTGTGIKGVSPETGRLFNEYRWPGNVRELEHLLMAQAVITPPDADFLTIPPEALGFTCQPGSPNKALPRSPQVKTLNQSRGEFERDFIIKSLRDNNFNITRTAQALGVTRQGLQYKMSRLNIRLTRSGQIEETTKSLGS